MTLSCTVSYYHIKYQSIQYIISNQAISWSDWEWYRVKEKEKEKKKESQIRKETDWKSERKKERNKKRVSEKVKVVEERKIENITL